jgi:hypothetical protein
MIDTDASEILIQSAGIGRCDYRDKDREGAIILQDIIGIQRKKHIVMVNAS